MPGGTSSFEIAGAQDGGRRQALEQGRIALALDKHQLALAAIRRRRNAIHQALAMRLVGELGACQFSNLGNGNPP